MLEIKTMSSVWRRFKALVELAYDPDYKSQYKVLALGIRKDGTLVCSSNGAARFPPSERIKLPMAHAEQRILRKLDKGAEVYVARLLKNGQFAIAKPCPNCRRILKSRGVARVFYTISATEYGVMEF